MAVVVPSSRAELMIEFAPFALGIKPVVSEVEVVLPPPPPAGVAHVPSPRQNVVEDALVPEFRFVTGRFPVTPVVRGSPDRKSVV